MTRASRGGTPLAARHPLGAARGSGRLEQERDIVDVFLRVIVVRSTARTACAGPCAACRKGQGSRKQHDGNGGSRYLRGQFHRSRLPDNQRRFHVLHILAQTWDGIFWIQYGQNASRLEDP